MTSKQVIFRHLRTSVQTLPVFFLLGCGNNVSAPVEKSTDKISVQEVSPSAQQDGGSLRAAQETIAGDSATLPKQVECVEGEDMVCDCADPNDDVNYKLISPNGGEEWSVGTEVMIHFCSEYTDTDEVSNCEIAISPDNGLNWYSLRNRGEWVMVAPHKYRWTVMDEFLVQDGGQLKKAELVDRPLMIRIRTYYGDRQVDWDTNDEPFTITSTSVSTRR